MAVVTEPQTERRSAPPAAPAIPAGRGGGRHKRFLMLVLGAVLVALAGLGLRRWLDRTEVSTDDAQVDGRIIPILPKVGGFVADVRLDDNQLVLRGDTLVVLDDRDYRMRLAEKEADLAVAVAEASNGSRIGQAQARVAQAHATALRARADLARMRPLAVKMAVSQEELDASLAEARVSDASLVAAQAALAAAEARVSAARAARDQAALNLAYTVILAPRTGVIGRKRVEVGQLVQAGQPLTNIVPLDDIWVTANFKETQTTNITPDQRSEFTVDAYPGRRFRGHVESLAPATGARFSLLPPDNATGNFTKVVQRIPVRIRLDQPNDPRHPLRPGMSAVVSIQTK